MANGDIWSYNRLEIDVNRKEGEHPSLTGYRIYSLTETTRGIIRHNNEVAVHSSVGEDVVTRASLKAKYFQRNEHKSNQNIMITEYNALTGEVTQER